MGLPGLLASVPTSRREHSQVSPPNALTWPPRPPQRRSRRSGWCGRVVGRRAGIRRPSWNGDKFPSPEQIKRPPIHNQPEYDGDCAEDISRDLRHCEREWDFSWLRGEGREPKERKPYDHHGDRASNAESEGAKGPGSGGTV